ncbi:MAG: hypothetical protein H5T97_11005 [Firmicutes bacterium]|nr:hypothetical protein [Bacillota bacterium]
MRRTTWIRRLHRLLALPAAVLLALTAVTGFWLNHTERAGPVPVSRPLSRPWDEAPPAAAERSGAGVWLKRVHAGRYGGTTLVGDATAAVLLVMAGTGLCLWLQARR